MLSLCGPGLWINNKQQDVLNQVEHYFVKKVSYVRKKKFSLHGLHSLRSGWSAFWEDQGQAGYVPSHWGVRLPCAICLVGINTGVGVTEVKGPLSLSNRSFQSSVLKLERTH